MPRSPRPAHLVESLLGVELMWANPPTEAWSSAAHDIQQLHQRMASRAVTALRRQQRSQFFYWDAFTCLAHGEPLPRRLRDARAFRVLSRALESVTRGSFDSQTIADLATLPVVRDARTRIVVPSAGKSRGAARAPCTVGADLVTGMPVVAGPGPYRVVEMPMGDLAGQRSIDWPRALLLAALAQLRFDAELHLETGVFRLGRCARSACQCFFARTITSVRQRYCSNACRASDRRETIRGVT